MNCIIILPIFNLILHKNIKKELKIENVGFVSREKLFRNLKKYGFPWNFSDLNKLLKGKVQAKLKIQSIRRFFENEQEGQVKTYAIIRISHDNKRDILKGLSRLQDAIWILASEQLLTKRNHIIRFGPPEHMKNIWNRYLLVPYEFEKSLYNSLYQRVTSVQEYVLGDRWNEDKKIHFFPHLIRMLNNKNNIDKKWLFTLRQVAILAGKSVFSREISIAFLYNMIGIEMLLKRGGESYEEVVPKRLNDLLGWIFGAEDKASYQAIREEIKRLYELRNNLVHKGNIKGVTIEDLIITDNYLFNLLQNFCRLVKVFPNRESVIKFGKELEARRILNIKLKRPKRLRFLRPMYNKKDFLEIEQKNSWPK